MKNGMRFTKKRKEPTSLDSRRRRKKSVTFSPSVLMYRTMHIKNFTDEEIDNTWYNAEEMKSIVNECVKIIAFMDSTGAPSSSECFRGLEFRTPQGQKKRTTHRFCAIDAVLREQDAQWEYEENDINQIRASYRAYSKPSRAEALRIGLEDAKEAMKIYQEGEYCSLVRNSSTQTPKSVCHKNFHVSPQAAAKIAVFLSHLQYHSSKGRAK